MESGAEMNKKIVFPHDFIYSFITLMFSTLDNIDVTKGLFAKALRENGMDADVADENAMIQLEDVATILESIKQIFPWEHIKDEDKPIAIEFFGKEEDFEEGIEDIIEEEEEEKEDNPFLGLDFGEFNIGPE